MASSRLWRLTTIGNNHCIRRNDKHCQFTRRPSQGPGFLGRRTPSAGARRRRLVPTDALLTANATGYLALLPLEAVKPYGAKARRKLPSVVVASVQFE